MILIKLIARRSMSTINIHIQDEYCNTNRHVTNGRSGSMSTSTVNKYPMQ